MSLNMIANISLLILLVFAAPVACSIAIEKSTRIAEIERGQ